MRFLVALLSLIAFSVPVAAQTETVIFKLKPEHRNMLPVLEQSVSSVSRSSFKAHRKFPNATPVAERNVATSRLVDLSLIYHVEVADADELVELLKRSKLVQYAEKEVVPELLYVPNDPLRGSQYYLNIIKAYQAWDISKGDTNVVIGITDTGIDFNHEDLAGNVKYNYADPINGIDDDNDGYTDNFRGWDTGDDDNDPQMGAVHGSHVSGISSAQTDNGVGIAGVGFNCKFLPVKIANSAGQLIGAYEGVVYAADHGCKIINCSWGSTTGAGSFGQDVINYATFNKGALVVAGAGNNNNSIPFYPAAYKNVLSVAATDSLDKKWQVPGSNGSNFGTFIDVSAPGAAIYSTLSANNYGNSSGTSMASPCAAGAAAIVSTVFPSYTPLQLEAQLKETSDPIDIQNPAYAGMLGKGRINLYRAVTESAHPSISLAQVVITDKDSSGNLTPGETGSIAASFTNFLSSAGPFTVTVSTSSGFISILSPTASLPALNTFDTAFAGPFNIQVSSSAPANYQVTLKFTISGAGYSTFEYYTFLVNRDFLNVEVNDISTTVTSNGRIGFNDSLLSQGEGFSYKGRQYLYDASFMAGVSAQQVSDGARGEAGYQNDFYSFVTVHRLLTPFVLSDFDTEGFFNDDAADQPMHIDVQQSSFSWEDSAASKFIIMRYRIRNTGTATLENFYAGIFADWDIFQYSKNLNGYDAAEKLGYSYHNSSPDYAAIRLLSASAPMNFHGIDATGSTGTFGLYNGFTEAEKYQALSTTSVAGTYPTDVSVVASSGPFTVAPGEVAEVAFAIIGGDNMEDIKASANVAQDRYDNVILVSSDEPGKAAIPLIVPNPASSTVSLKSDGDCGLDVCSLDGRRVISVARLAAGEKLDVSHLSPGCYFYIVNRNGERSAGKLVITR